MNVMSPLDTPRYKLPMLNNMDKFAQYSGDYSLSQRMPDSSPHKELEGLRCNECGQGLLDILHLIHSSELVIRFRLVVCERRH